MIKHILSDKNLINFFKFLMKDFLKVNQQIYSTKFHIQKSIDWIIYAKEATLDDGISLGYSLIYGWLPSYPETSGYIIPTLMDFYNTSNKNKYLIVSKKIANWLCSIQLKNGGFQGGTIDQEKFPSIFNTGQILLGLIRAFKEFDDQKYFNSAIKAGDFLIKNQQQNGNWKKFCYNNVSHIYNTRTSWALLELYNITENIKYRNGAVKNLNWAYKQINKNLFFQWNRTFSFENPILHFISYTIRGFLEAGLILENENYLNTAINSSLQLLDYFETYEWLPATFNSNWKSKDHYSCLTGNAQLSIIWLKIFLIKKEERFLKNALNLNNILKSKQIINRSIRNINGAVKGSDPIWGKYMRWTFPNWATKFFCDSLLLEDEVMKLK